MKNNMLGYLVIFLTLIFPFRTAYIHHELPNLTGLLSMVGVVVGFMAGMYILLNRPFERA